MKFDIKYIAASFLLAGTLTAQNINVDVMPKAGPTPTINITQPKTFTLKNGLTVMVVENNKLPRVSTTLSMDRPPVYEGKVVGVSSILASQLGNGTTTKTKDDFNKRVDFLGANLNFSSAGASANTLSKYYPEVLGLMADAVINPKFTQEEIQKAKDRSIEGLKADEKSASAIANKVNNALMYGKNTAFGEFETEESINAIQLADVQDFYSKNYAPDNAYLVIVGDVKFDEVKKLVEKNFKNWKKSNTKYPAITKAANVAQTEINVVDVPNAVQSVVNVGNISNITMNNKQYFPAIIANYILGGGGDGRLFLNLREKNGFTYGAYSSLNTNKFSPSFAAEASVRNEVTDKAVVEFMNEIKAISQVKPEELTNAKAKLKGDFIRSLESPATIARFALMQKTQNLPADFYSNYLKSIDNVSAADVSNAVKNFALPNQSRIFIAGKGSEIAESLDKLGYPVKYFDNNANPTTKPEVKKVAENVTVASVVGNYIKAIGGNDAIKKITSVSTTSSATVQGMAMDMKRVQSNTGKMLVDVSMMGNSMQKIVFDGKEGYMQMQGNKIPMTDDIKKEMAAEAHIFPELAFANSADYKVTGIENHNGEEAYVVKGANTTLYYSVKTGLKLATIKSQKGMDGKEVQVPTSFSDYKEVSGVKFPYKTTTNMAGMNIEFITKEVVLNKATDADFK